MRDILINYEDQSAPPPGMGIIPNSDAKILIQSPFVSTLFQLYRGWVNHEVASIWLKIAEQVAYG